MDQQTDWQTTAKWPRSSTDTIKFADCFLGIVFALLTVFAYTLALPILLS
jgi:hypothetical protein